MAEPEKIQEPGKPDTARATGAPESESPEVESPSISPAEDVSKNEPVKPATKIHALTLFTARAEQAPPSTRRFTIPRLTITRRMKRRAMMAASVTLAAAFGAVVGALANQGFTAPEAPKVDNAAVEETQAMRKSIAHLSKEITTLKAGIESATKTAAAQIGKVAERIDKIDRGTDTTGSISKTTALATAPVAAETPLPVNRPQIVQGWTARASSDGTILVEGRGEVYQVTPGVPLPGLGRVESIKRDGERWVVATPKGIIISSNAAPPPRLRQYYPPPYFRPF